MQLLYALLLEFVPNRQTLLEFMQKYRFDFDFTFWESIPKYRYINNRKFLWLLFIWLTKLSFNKNVDCPIFLYLD